MAQCALCMSEVHPEATVCAACGAVKSVRSVPGILKSIAIVFLLIIWLLFTLAGHYMAGFGVAGVAVFLGVTSKRQVFWSKKV